MNALNTLELRLADLYAKLPSLPRNARRWLAVNAWWISLVIAIISTLVLLAAIPSLFLIAGLRTYSSIYAYTSVSVGVLLTSTIINLALAAVSVVLLYLAVQPLKEMRHRGWKLLFTQQLIGVVSAVVNFIILIQQANVLGLIWALIITAVELYFLYQVRGEFSSRAAKASEATIVVPKSAKKAK